MDWDTEEEAKGYMSCCTLAEMSEKIGFLPEIEGEYKNDQDLLDEGGEAPPQSPPGSQNGMEIVCFSLIFPIIYYCRL